MTDNHDAMHAVDLIQGIDKFHQGGGRNTLSLGCTARQRRGPQAGAEGNGKGGSQREFSQDFHSGRIIFLPEIHSSVTDGFCAFGAGVYLHTVLNSDTAMLNKSTHIGETQCTNSFSPQRGEGVRRTDEGWCRQSAFSFL